MGYSWAVAKAGGVFHDGAAGLARSMGDGGVLFTAQTRLHIASISKGITAVAVLKLLADEGYDLTKLDQVKMLDLLCKHDPSIGPDWDRCPNPYGPGIDQVTVKQLLTMTSCLPINQGYPNVAYTDNTKWNWLSNFLANSSQSCADTCTTCNNNKGNNCCCNGTSSYCCNGDCSNNTTYYYNNNNFVILEAIIEAQRGQSYESWVQQHVLAPMGIDTTVFSAVPDPQSSSALTYLDSTDTTTGVYWGDLTFIGPGGWIASADELVKFAAGVAAHTVLTESQTQTMFSQALGWYAGNSPCGGLHLHNGGLETNCGGGDPGCCQGLSTGLVVFDDGTGAVLLVNSQESYPGCRTNPKPSPYSGWDPIGTIVNAFSNYR
jgi:CubicO group peptidase (beta-lactamase class C family)